MSGSLTIRGAQLVLPGRVVPGDLLIEDGVITQLGPHIEAEAGEVIDGEGLTCLPGGIDTHVHFGDPGFTRSEDLSTGSRAAAAGGVTAFLDLPDTLPTTTTVSALHDKLASAATRSSAHYGFFLGATPENVDVLRECTRAAGVLLNLAAMREGHPILNDDLLDTIVRQTSARLVVMAQAAERTQDRVDRFADVTDPTQHGVIYDERCYEQGLKQILDITERHGRSLHIANVSTQGELALLRQHARPGLTAAVTPQHLFLGAEDAYARLGNRAVMLPPLREKPHRSALWEALRDDELCCVSSAHRAHRAESKERPYPSTPPGMPGVEWLLPVLLDQAAAGRCTLPQIARWFSEAPARTFRIPRKGRLEVGYDGDIVLVDTHRSRVVGSRPTRTRCGWSPWEGRYLTGWPVLTALLGEPVFRDDELVDGVFGQELTFTRTSESQ